MRQMRRMRVSAIDPSIRSGRTIDAIPLDGWRVDVGYPEDREEAEARLEGKFEAEVTVVRAESLAL